MFILVQRYGDYEGDDISNLEASESKDKLDELKIHYEAEMKRILVAKGELEQAQQQYQDWNPRPERQLNKDKVFELVWQDYAWHNPIDINYRANLGVWLDKFNVFTNEKISEIRQKHSVPEDFYYRKPYDYYVEEVETI